MPLGHFLFHLHLFDLEKWLHRSYMRKTPQGAAGVIFKVRSAEGKRNKRRKKQRNKEQKKRERKGKGKERKEEEDSPVCVDSASLQKSIKVSLLLRLKISLHNQNEQKPRVLLHPERDPLQTTLRSKTSPEKGQSDPRRQKGTHTKKHYIQYIARKPPEGLHQQVFHFKPARIEY